MGAPLKIKAKITKCILRFSQGLFDALSDSILTGAVVYNFLVDFRLCRCSPGSTRRNSELDSYYLASMDLLNLSDRGAYGRSRAYKPYSALCDHV